MQDTLVYSKMKTIIIILSITCLASSAPSRTISVQAHPKLKEAEGLISIAADVVNEKTAAVLDAKSELLSIAADAAAKKGRALIKAGSRIKSAVLKGAFNGISAIGSKLVYKVGLLSGGSSGGGSIEVRPPGGSIVVKPPGGSIVVQPPCGSIVIDNKPPTVYPPSIPCIDQTGVVIGYLHRPEESIVPGTVWGPGMPPEGEVPYITVNKYPK